MKEKLEWAAKEIGRILACITIGCFIAFLLLRKCGPQDKPLVLDATPIETFKDKDSALHVVTPVLMSTPEQLLALKSQDGVIIALQDQVAKYKKELGKQGGVTVIKGTNSIDTAYTKAYVPKLSDKQLRWSDSIRNKHINWNYKVVGDSCGKAQVFFKLETVDDYSVITKEKSNGWFKPKTLVTEVVNHNPYSKKMETATYKVETKVPSKSFSIGPNVSYGVGANGLSSFVGIGLQYGIIRF